MSIVVPMRDVTTTHLRQNMGGVVTQVLGGESVRLTRGGHVIGYMVSPRDWATLDGEHRLTPPPIGVPIAALADRLGVPAARISRLVSELIRQPHWGREKVIADISPDSVNHHGVTLQPEAAEAIAQIVEAEQQGAAE